MVGNMCLLTDEQNKRAAQQLGLGDGFKAFMASASLDYLDDYQTAFEGLEAEGGHFSSDDAIGLVEAHRRDVRLPIGFIYVGMQCGDGETHYGIVQLGVDPRNGI